VFCGRHLLAAKLRRSNIDACAGAMEEVARGVRRIRARWPRVRILLRADSGFARETLMAWCEANRVAYLFGLARNARLVAEIEAEIAQARTIDPALVNLKKHPLHPGGGDATRGHAQIAGGSAGRAPATGDWAAAGRTDLCGDRGAGGADADRGVRHLQAVRGTRRG
jgi:hypothetical protein